MLKYRCTICDWVYDPSVGDPEHNISTGTPFEELPDDWRERKTLNLTRNKDMYDKKTMTGTNVRSLL